MLKPKDRIDQLDVIFDVIGTPSEEDISSIRNDTMRKRIASLPSRPKKPLSELFPSAPEEVR